MAVNKVIYGGNTLVDLTGDTVTAADLADGVKATGADGNPVIGLMQKVTIDAELSTTSTNPVQNKVIKEALDGKLGKNETAAAAIKDGAGNNIVDTYAKKTDIPNITVDAELSDTSTNPVQNKVVKTNMDSLYNNVKSRLNAYRSEIPTKVSDLENDAGYLTQHQSLEYEKYVSYVISGATSQPASSVMQYTATGAFTLNLSSISSKLAAKEATVFTAYIKSDADYTLSITHAGTIKYIGNASDVAITSAGLLLNILITRDTNDNVTSIVQASKLS